MSLFVYSSKVKKWGEMKRRPRLNQAGSRLDLKSVRAEQMIVTEQDVRIGPPVKRAWLIITLVVAGLILGLFWFTSLTTDQPPLYPSSATSNQSSEQPYAAGETLAPQPLQSQGYETTQLHKADPLIVPDVSISEILVRRFYDEVLNQGYEQAMPYLFAGQMTYQACDELPMTFSAVEFSQRLRAEKQRFHGLIYTIEHIIVAGDRVSVSWSAEGQPVAPSVIDSVNGEKMFWSGLTVWQITNGKIVAAQSIDAGGEAIRLAADDTWLVLACGVPSARGAQPQSAPS